ncbi:small cell adhesion glycoprotein-like [Centroberyx affinis]|uniref:small cell adhesion glycoprotein-like n=1 Tax=Centroberyx affinis TaxID=166261 RepID=UPI003A5BD161
MTSSPAMNASEMGSFTTLSTHANITLAEDMGSLTSRPTQADTTMIEAVTTAVPMHTDSTVIGVVIVLVLLTVAVLGFLLYRYLCHNKGDYRTTGEPAPGEDPDDDCNDRATSEKKEYFI